MAASAQHAAGGPSSNTAIDFIWGTSISSQTIILVTPHEGDSLEVIAQKMEDIANVLRAGKSVAVAENFKSENVILPPMAWETMKERAFTVDNTKKRNNARVEAIRLLYCYPRATGEHLACIPKHLEHTVLPLIKAIVRAENVKKDSRGGQSVNIEEWAEFQCLKHTQSTAARLQQQQMERMKRLKLEIKAAMDVLGSREKRIGAG